MIKFTSFLVRFIVGGALALMGSLAWADFVVAYSPISLYPANLYIVGANGTTGTITSTDGAINQSYTIGSSGVVSVPLGRNQTLLAVNTVQSKAMAVTSSSPVSVYTLVYANGMADATYVLDKSALGTDYRVLAWPSGTSPAQVSQMSVTATQNGTSVTVTPSVPLASGQAAGVPFTFSLNAGQSVLFEAPAAASVATAAATDLTGSHISATAPVAVFTGTRSSFVPLNVTQWADALYEQLLPTNLFAKEFVVPETALTGTAGNVVRVLAATDGTVVTVNGSTVATLAAGAMYEIPTAHNLHIITSQPALVGQYLKSASVTSTAAANWYGDPAMTFIPGLNQTLAEYNFTTLPGDANAYAPLPVIINTMDVHSLAVAVPTSALGSLQLNGAAVDTSGFVAVGTSGYSAGTVALPNTVTLMNIKASAPFVATIAGFGKQMTYLATIGTTYSLGVSPEPSTPPAVPSTPTAVPVPTSSPFALLLLALALAGLGLRYAQKRLHWL